MSSNSAYLTIKLLTYFFSSFLAYEQMYVRTMFYEKVDPTAHNPPASFIDGVKYEMTSLAVNDTFKYKGYLVDIFNTIDPEMMDTSCTFDSYTSWNKELIK